jgi:hypothetical protein
MKMKKIYFFIFFSVYTFTLNAQYKPSFGLKLGVNVPNVAVSSNKLVKIDTDNKYGITAGLFIELPVIYKLNVLSELGYEQKFTGAGTVFYSNGYPVESHSLEERSDYLVYALKAKYFLTDRGVNPYTVLGVSVSIFLDSHLFSTHGEVPETAKILMDENFKRFSYYPVIGAGCEFKMSSSYIFLTEINFAVPTGSYFEYSSYGVSARTYTLDLKIGLKF